MTNPAAGLSLDRPGLAPVWDELARRYGEGGPPPVSITVRDLTDAQRQAVADLLGADRLVPAVARIRTARLAAALGVDSGAGLRRLVEELRGPLGDRRADREAHRAARGELWDWLETEAGRLALFRCGDAAGRWAGRVRSAGISRGDVDGHRRRLAAVLSVLRHLPADGIALASLAQDHLGDPHGLDRGRSAAALVLDAMAIACDVPAPSGAEAVRDLWEAHGVVPDPLSSTVLVLGLRPDGDDPLARWLQAAATVGEPVSLTLAQLRRWPLPPLPAGSAAYVVENPSLLGEAAALLSARWSLPPVVCSSGRPTVAVVTLLRQLGAAGGVLAQHADFDAAGLGITAWLTQQAGTTPWRMTAADYTAAAGARPDHLPLAGPLPATPWDPALAEAMTEAGVAVYEEELRTELLTAIATAHP